MGAYFKEIWTAAVNIAKGLRVTLVYLFKPAVTVQYPFEKLAPYDAFRGVLLFDPKTCIACGLCAKACPSECIALENLKNEAGKRIPKIDWYSVDLGKCNFCRLCEEACPTKPKSVWHSLDYELTFDSRDAMLRYWKAASAWTGQAFDPGRKDFAPPEGQLHVQSVPPRREA